MVIALRDEPALKNEVCCFLTGFGDVLGTGGRDPRVGTDGRQGQRAGAQTNRTPDELQLFIRVSVLISILIRLC